MHQNLFEDAKNKLTIHMGPRTSIETVTDGPHAIWGTLKDIVNGQSDIDVNAITKIEFTCEYK